MPFLLLGQLTSGWTLTVLVAIGGMFLQSTLPINVTFGQQVAPVSAATVSSLMMGAGWGVGSLFAPVVGMVGILVGTARRAFADCGGPAGWRRCLRSRCQVGCHGMAMAGHRR